jgi:hypothetical protein
MKSRICGIRTPYSLGHRCYGPQGNFNGSRWRIGKPRMKGESTSGAFSYLDYVSDAASVQAYRRNEADPLLSAESLPENSSFLDFKSFALEHPDRLFRLLSKLRVEFQELFIEYYMLEKSQSFLAKTHGCIQTRIWQNLRIIEQAVGSLIVLGIDPGPEVLRPILLTAELENTSFGSLTDMIVLYAQTQSYAAVAKKFNAPIPAIRKILRPAIGACLSSKKLKVIAVGCYLRSLTHQASLTGGGLSHSAIARIRRVKHMKFHAPPSDNTMLMNFGAISVLHDTPWCMFEISSEHRMEQINPSLRKHGKKLFGKRAAQIFAPTDENRELEVGYLMARSVSPALTRSLTRIRGISEMSGHYSEDGTLLKAVTIPNADVQKMIKAHSIDEPTPIRVGDFVEILTGEAARYHGTVVEAEDADMKIEVQFPSGRKFTVDASAADVKLLRVPIKRRAFWGQSI